jgi:hypothetical protein
MPRAKVLCAFEKTSDEPGTLVGAEGFSPRCACCQREFYSEVVYGSIGNIFPGQVCARTGASPMSVLIGFNQSP